MTDKARLTAVDLQAMLAQRHSDDVFVSECKDGPTQTRNHLRLDAWVLAKTWSPITAIGYEIKVDRGDWRRDEKIHNYMPLCHVLYVVAPKGVVPVDELPAGVGLLEPIGAAGRLQMKRKAARREIVLPAELMVYVLMCRTKITREQGTFDQGERHWRTEHLRRWVEGKAERESLSYAVSAKIRSTFAEQERQLANERHRNDQLDEVRKRIAELGFDPSKPVNSWQVRGRLAQFNRAVDNGLLYDMRQMSKTLTITADALELLKDGRQDDSSEQLA